MKVYTQEGRVIAEAETLADIETLQSLKGRKHKEHKKHQFPKRCELCDKVCKGNVGLGIHMAKCKKLKVPAFEVLAPLGHIDPSLNKQQ